MRAWAEVGNPLTYPLIVADTLASMASGIKLSMVQHATKDKGIVVRVCPLFFSKMLSLKNIYIDSFPFCNVFF